MPTRTSRRAGLSPRSSRSRPGPRRRPRPTRPDNRRRDAAASSDARTFASAPDTDPSLAPNRQWARELLARVPSSHLGVKTRDEHTVTDPAELDRILAAGAETAREAAAPTLAEVKKLVGFWGS